MKEDDRGSLKSSPFEALPTLQSVKGVEWAVQIDICELHFVGIVMLIKTSYTFVYYTHKSLFWEFLSASCCTQLISELIIISRRNYTCQTTTL
jgi:hypothetical protein